MDPRARLNLPDVGGVRRFLKITTVTIALIAGLSAFASTKTTNRASSVLAVLPPAETQAGAPRNPIATIDDRTAHLASLVAGLVDDPAIQKAAIAEGATEVDATPVDGDANSSPASSRVRLSVTAPTSSQAVAGLRAAETQLKNAFSSFQAKAGVVDDAKQAHLVRMFREVPSTTTNDRVRAGAAAFLGVILLGLIVITLIGRTRRHAADEDIDGDELPSPLDDELTVDGATPPEAASTSDEQTLRVEGTRPTRDVPAAAERATFDASVPPSTRPTAPRRPAPTEPPRVPTSPRTVFQDAFDQAAGIDPAPPPPAEVDTPPTTAPAAEMQEPEATEHVQADVETESNDDRWPQLPQLGAADPSQTPPTDDPDSGGERAT